MRPLLLLLLLLTLPARAEAPAYAPGAPADARAYAFQPHPGAPVPLDAPLLAEDGTPTTLRQLAQGRPILLALNYFHCPNICGTLRDDAALALAGTTLTSADRLVAFVTIDPAETPADARAARASADPPLAGAAYLSGDATPLKRAVGFPTRWDPVEKQFLHPAGLVVLSPAGQVSSYLLGVGYTPESVQAAISAARTGTVAAPPNPILLLCFHYDPVTGRYTPAITRILQLAAALTAATLLATLAWSHRRRA